MTSSNTDGLITKKIKYDRNGNILYEEDDRGNQTQYVYDNFNRKTEIHYADSSKEIISYRKDNLVDLLTTYDSSGLELFNINSG